MPISADADALSSDNRSQGVRYLTNLVARNCDGDKSIVSRDRYR